jgi:hypothetical protein
MIADYTILFFALIGLIMSASCVGILIQRVLLKRRLQKIMDE